MIRWLANLRGSSLPLVCVSVPEWVTEQQEQDLESHLLFTINKEKKNPFEILAKLNNN